MNLARPTAATKRKASLRRPYHRELSKNTLIQGGTHDRVYIQVCGLDRWYAERLRPAGVSGVVAQDCVPVWQGGIPVGQPGAADGIGGSRQCDQRTSEGKQRYGACRKWDAR